MRSNFATWLSVALATAWAGGLLCVSAAGASGITPDTVMAAQTDRDVLSGGIDEASDTGGSAPASIEHCSLSPEADDSDRELNLSRSSAASRLAFGGRGCTLRRLTDFVFVEDEFDPD